MREQMFENDEIHDLPSPIKKKVSNFRRATVQFKNNEKFMNKINQSIYKRLSKNINLDN